MSLQTVKINSPRYPIFKSKTYSSQSFAGNPPAAETFTPDTFNGQPSRKKNKGGTWLLGLACIITAGIAIYSWVKSHKKVSFEEAQRALSEIFGKEYSKEEAENLIKKYTEIYKDRSSKDYYQKLVNQLKEDYGIKEVKTTLKIDTSIGEGNYRVGGSATRKGKITIYPENLKAIGDNDGFNTLFHELKHIRQYAEVYMADPNQFAKAIAENSLPLKENQSSIKKLIKRGYTQERAEQLVYDNLYRGAKDELDSVFSGLEKFKKDSPEYKKGLEYIKTLLKDTTADPQNEAEMIAYKNKLSEKEAFKCGENAQKLLKYIKEHL